MSTWSRASSRVPSRRILVPPLGRQGLGNPEDDHEDEQARESGDDAEDPAPPDQLHENAAEDRGHHGGDALDRHDDAERPGRGDTAGAVGDDGAPQDHAGGTAEPLEEAGHEQEGEAGRQGRADAGGQGEHTAPQEEGPAAEPVGQDADAELPERNAHQEGRHRQLDAGGGDAQVVGHLAEGRQVGIGGQRRDSGERGEGQEERRRESGSQPAVGRRGRIRVVHAPSPPQSRARGPRARSAGPRTCEVGAAAARPSPDRAPFW